LVRGGAKGHALSLREGGLKQTQIYLRNWLDRRRERNTPTPFLDPEGLDGALLFGWHPPEPAARWTADFAGLRIPADGVELVRIEGHLESGRTLRLHEEKRVVAEASSGTLEAKPARADRPAFVLETTGIRVNEEQRKHGDAR